MNCLRCDNHEFVRKDHAVIEQEFRGENLKVKSPAMACSKCGWVTVGLNQLDELRRSTADAYREKHGLLTSQQIRHYRKLLGKSQREFADFLHVGEASVKRWETWLVQERGSDELIRTKCEQELRQRFAKQTTMTIFVACDYVKAGQHSAHATSVLSTKKKLSGFCNWPRPVARVKRNQSASPELSKGAAYEELALAA